VVPPRSDRVSRAPPYSRTRLCSCPYGAVTRSGAPFQTLPVRKGRATGLVRVRSSLLAESHVDVLSSGYLDISVRRVRLLPLWIHDKIPLRVGCPIRRSRDHRALAPPPSFSQRATSFIASRCQGIHQMPLSCSPTPSPKAALGAARGQRSDDRGQRHRPTKALRRCIDHRPCPGALRRIAPTGATGPGVSAYPCPGTTEPPPKVRRPRRLLLSCPLHGHDSLHDVKTSHGPRRPRFGQRAPSSSRAAPADQSPPGAHPRLVVGLGRLERPTSRLSGVRSSQLSYRPGSEDRRQRTDLVGSAHAAPAPPGLSSVLCRLSSGRDAPAAAGARPGQAEALVRGFEPSPEV
jgi:hypothetical protein